MLAKNMEKKIRELKKSLPKFAGHFLDDALTKKKPATVLSYATDLRDFLSYAAKAYPEYHAFPVTALPAHVMIDRKPDDFTVYLGTLLAYDRKDKKYRPVAPTVKKRVLSSLAAVYRWLADNGYIRKEKNPIKDVKRENLKDMSVHVMSDSESLQLINGIKKNDKYLIPVEGPNGEPELVLDDIDSKARIRREQQVSRNTAILSLLLYIGLKTREIHELDVGDILYEKQAGRVWNKNARSPIHGRSPDGALGIPAPETDPARTDRQANLPGEGRFPGILPHEHGRSGDRQSREQEVSPE